MDKTERFHLGCATTFVSRSTCTDWAGPHGHTGWEASISRLKSTHEKTNGTDKEWWRITCPVAKLCGGYPTKSCRPQIRNML